ncbi:MAG: MFS transporter [Planctomycetaceae bacterium]
MPSLPTPEDSSPKPASGAKSATSPEPARRWNIVALLIHQVLFRIAWIFKTESVIMPAFLDTVSDSGFIRGALPLLNRTGQSVAPLLMSDRLSSAPRKAAWLSRTTFLMGTPFLFLSFSIWYADAKLPEWFAVAFLVAYAVFFCLHGVNEMAASTVLGKLVEPSVRGRLQAAASTLGTTFAITLAVLLLSRWLTAPGQRPFEWIFLFVGSVMMIAGVWARALREPIDSTGDRTARRTSVLFRDTFALLRTDKVLRRLCVTAVLFIFSQIIFPHYQWLGLSLPGSKRTALMTWVIAQHVGAAVFSTISGFLADRFGTRAALRLLLTCAAFAPLLAIGLAEFSTFSWYWITFFWIGLVPVTLRMQVNYAIEIVARERHPEYISTLNLCMAIPFLFSPLVGGFVHWFGHIVPFCAVSIIVLTGSLLTWTMKEPRRDNYPAKQQIAEGRKTSG